MWPVVGKGYHHARFTCIIVSEFRAIKSSRGPILIKGCWGDFSRLASFLNIGATKI